MLRTYFLYQKYELYIDKKIEEYTEDNFWNFMKIIIPLVITLHYRFNNGIGAIASIIYFLIFMFSVKYIRNIIKNKFFKIQIFIKKLVFTIWGQNIDYSEKLKEKKIIDYNKNSKNILKDLFLIYSLYPKKNDMKFFYIITVYDEIKTYYKIIDEIQNIKKDDYVNITINDDIDKIILIFNKIIEQVRKDRILFEKDIYEKNLFLELINLEIII